jgi:hypothetical protein
MKTDEKYYSEEEIAIIKKHYPDHGGNYCRDLIEKKLGKVRTYLAIKLKAQKLGIKVINNPSLYKKGRKAHNKGKKISPETYAKISRTFFKKGQKPHNTRHKYALSKRERDNETYWFIRFELRDWKLLHRVIYENVHNVKIKKDECVVFLDGNTDNIHPDNLKLLTRAENMNRNNPRMHYPQEVVDIIIMNNKLKRKINSYAKKQNKRSK